MICIFKSYFKTTIGVKNGVPGLVKMSFEPNSTAVSPSLLIREVRLYL